MRSIPLKIQCMITAAVAWALWPGGVSRSAESAEKIRLSNELTVVVAEEHSLPFVTFLLLVDAGALRDPASGAGLANLTAEGLLLGTENRSLPEINEDLDFMGADLNASCGWDYTILRLRTLL